ncbi:hypothetical protein CO669_12015 [Bradyrhizobium sp. Y36]|uniref:hypothetical protein n=1 Tax=Bradyrhizobium sp. Y36 TaxID=2035447 RepID=UPI000BEA471C|nr:hypothetical protein [Bradyrhizobium sp. Y36]PDT90179.1 hypothetical protein CO669_12015 [Bradyrhizobium sp. Y36]
MDFDHIVKVLGLVGGFAGLGTLLWRFWDLRRAFLHIEVSVDAIGGNRVKVRTVVENSTNLPRRLDIAFLVVGPENDGALGTALKLLPDWRPEGPGMLNQMVREITSVLKKDGTTIASGARMIVPLTYYYRENVNVADEKLSYEHIIPAETFPAGTYAVRFYVEGAPRLHRVVHAAFHVESLNKGAV